MTPLCSEAGQGKVMWHQCQVVPLRALISKPRGCEDVLFSIDLATLSESTDILTTICEPAALQSVFHCSDHSLVGFQAPLASAWPQLPNVVSNYVSVILFTNEDLGVRCQVKPC